MKSSPVWLAVWGLLQHSDIVAAANPRTYNHIQRRQVQNVTTEWGSVCEDIVFPVHVNKTAPGEISTDVWELNALYGLADRQTLIEADYNMSARICHPPADTPDLDTIQVLVHGATFNKHMWDFPYQPANYSWVRRMNLAGYTTFAIDLIGSGNSSLPNGLYEVQTGMLTDSTHDMLQQLKTGALTSGRRFGKVTFVGFSIGAIIANSIADQYPDDFDENVLLGVSWHLPFIYPAFLSGLQMPAATIDPERWGSYPPTYQTHGTLKSRELACFWGDYDQEALETDYALRDMDCAGAAISFTFHLVDAPAFTGPVFLGIGDTDGTFCGKKCGSQPYAVYDKFPAAASHEVKVYPNTGHALMFHHSAPQLFDDVVAFMKSNA